MPNAIIVNNRLKPNNQVKQSTLVKVEKENENTDIRRRMRNVNKDRVLNTKQETVWERLSKVRKSASNDSGLVSSSKNKMVTRTKSTVRFPPLRNSTNQTQKKPLSAPNPNTNVKRFPDKKQQQMLQQQQQAYSRLKTKPYHELPMLLPPLPAVPPRMMLSDEIPFCKPVKEILTVRTMNNSKSSSDESKDSEKKPSNPYLFRRANTIGCPGKYDMKELKKPRPMIDSSSYSQISADDCDLPTKRRCSAEEIPLDSSLKIEHNFERLLKQKQKSMPAEEIRLIKNVVKSDDRYRNLRRTDERLFKDILKTQLREILKQGTVVKSALHHLNATDSESQAKLQAVLPRVSPEKPGSSTDVQQVDVIFKNVPTLEKEIIILRALGEKLEATLKRTVGPGKSPPRKSAVSPTSRVKRSAFLMYDATRIGKISHRVVGVQCLATVHVRSKGIMRTLGFVREFYIAHKTIVELKNEANRHFYLPMNGPRMELKRTNFQKLQQNPDILMQHLKPKNPDVAFNVLEQDPIFFHSLIQNTSGPAGLLHKKDISARTSSEEESPIIVSLCEGGDSTKLLRNDEINEKDKRTDETDFSEYFDVNKNQAWMHSYGPKNIDIIDASEYVLPPQVTQSTAGALKVQKKNVMIIAEVPKRRRRIRRTPMPMNKYVAPKNNLLKTILVGSIQISCFLLLIMAFTYPDLKC